MVPWTHVNQPNNNNVIYNDNNINNNGLIYHVHSVKKNLNHRCGLDCIFPHPPTDDWQMDAAIVNQIPQHTNSTSRPRSQTVQTCCCIFSSSSFCRWYSSKIFIACYTELIILINICFVLAQKQKKRKITLHQRLRLEHAWIYALYKFYNNNNKNLLSTRQPKGFRPDGLPFTQPIDPKHWWLGWKFFMAKNVKMCSPLKAKTAKFMDNSRSYW